MISVADKPVYVRRLLAGFFLAVAIAQTGVSQAAESGLVHIRADNMKYDMKSGISSYTGNVLITYIGMELSGDSVTVKQQDDEIEQLVVTGKPARYRQSTDSGENIVAESMTMTYSTTNSQLVLTDQARLEQAGHIVESQRIIYDTAQEVVIAGQVSPQDRVNITLTPKKPDPQPSVPAPEPVGEGHR